MISNFFVINKQTHHTLQCFLLLTYLMYEGCTAISVGLWVITFCATDVKPMWEVLLVGVVLSNMGGAQSV